MERVLIDYIIQGAIAVGTVGALFAALFQIWRDRNLRLKEKREEQASNVAAWFEDVVLSSEFPGNQSNAFRSVLIRNDNLTPRYDVVITVVGLHGAGPHQHGESNEGNFAFRTVIPQVATGLWGTWIDTGGGGMGVICALEISFRDGAGISWIRRGSGELIEIKKEPLEYYSIPLPASWKRAERIVRK